MLSLSKEQKEGIADRLRTNRTHGVLIRFASKDADASGVAHDFAQVLCEGGWEVSGPSPAGYVPMEGVLIGVDDVSRPHPSARLLVDVLTAVGITTRVVQAAMTGLDRCSLIVGGETKVHREWHAA